MGSNDRDTAREMIAMVDTFKKTIIVSICALVLYSCASSPSRIDTGSLKKRSQPVISAAGLERQIHTLINKERRKQGLSHLEWDEALADIGRKHSKDMARRNYFDHNSPEGHDFSYRYHHEGYQCAIRVNRKIYMGAENIAQNNLYDSITTVNGNAFYNWNTEVKIAETTVRGWMKSPGHRKNILTPFWRHEGIGVIIGPGEKVFITQNFC
jgi:uncharacterized protein YkwD